MAYRGQQQGMRRGGRNGRGGHVKGQAPPPMPAFIKGRGQFKRGGPRNGNAYRWAAQNIASSGRLGVDEDGDEVMTGEQAQTNQQLGDGRQSRADFVHSNRGGARGRGGLVNRNHLNRLGLPVDTNRPTWYKVMLPFCARLTEAYLLQLLRQHTQQDFTPLNFKSEGKQAVFFVKTKEESDALRKISGSITLDDGYKVKILITPQLAPDVESLSTDQLNLLKEVMSLRYDVNQRALNLSDFGSDERFRNAGLVLNLARPSIMKEICKVITEHIPEVQSINLSRNKLDTLQAFGSITPVTTQLCKLDVSFNKIGEMSDLNAVLALRLVDLNVQNNPFLQTFKGEHDVTKSGICLSF